MLSLDQAVLDQYVELGSFDPDPSNKKKFILARQLDLICSTLEASNYLDFPTLAELVLSVSNDYFHGRPSKADEGDVFPEWAYAKNCYHIARKLIALRVAAPTNLSAPEQADFLTAFEQLKYSYLLHRIYEIRDMLTAYMGRWGYSDLWSCFDRLINNVESLHKAETSKRINSAKRFNYWLAKIKNSAGVDQAFRDEFLALFAEDCRRLWAEEIARVYVA